MDTGNKGPRISITLKCVEYLADNFTRAQIDDLLTKVLRSLSRSPNFRAKGLVHDMMEGIVYRFGSAGDDKMELQMVALAPEAARPHPLSVPIQISDLEATAVSQPLVVPRHLPEVVVTGSNTVIPVGSITQNDPVNRQGSLVGLRFQTGNWWRDHYVFGRVNAPMMARKGLNIDKPRLVLDDVTVSKAGLHIDMLVQHWGGKYPISKLTPAKVRIMAAFFRKAKRALLEMRANPKNDEDESE